jgi:hypothetical protein
VTTATKATDEQRIELECGATVDQFIESLVIRRRRDAQIGANAVGLEARLGPPSVLEGQ